MSRTYLHLALALALLLVTVACALFWYGAFSALGTQVAVLSSEVAASDARAAQAVSAKDELAKRAGEEKKIQGYFIAPADVVSFLEALQAAGTAEGASVNVASVSANPSPRPHLDLALSVTGSFEAVMRTVGAIEYGPHDIRVATLTVETNSGSGSGDSGGWIATLALEAGTPPAAAAASAQPTP